MQPERVITQTHAASLLKQALGDPNAAFRLGQWEAIDALTNRRERLLVVERTGWGKSSVYFIATRILRDRGAGPTLIVSPLLALMRNQIAAAERLRIRAGTINSSNTPEWSNIVAQIERDEVDALLISPERLANDEFVHDVLLPIANRVGLLVVDEAHCISDWGHDFRPDYRRLVNVIQRLPRNLPVLGTTATANNRVVNDAKVQLGNLKIQRGPLMRASLALQSLKLPDQAARLAWLAEHLPHLSGTGIVYVLTKRDADQVANWLNQNGIAAASYYSDVTAEGFANANAYREHLEEMLLCNRLKALVATTALGMGYDKPDLGFVVHYQAPGSIVAYYQQVGRAGRAISRAVGVLMSGREDEDIQAYFRETAFPSEYDVNTILQALARSDGLTERQLEGVINLRYGQIQKVLKYLSVENPAPVFKEGKLWKRSAVNWRMDHVKIARLTRQRAEEWAEVQQYINTRQCLMAFLANALDDTNPQPCGKCANCTGKPVVPVTVRHDLGVTAARFIRQSKIPLECKKQVAANSFPIYGFSGNLPAEWRAESGRILSHWGDAGWGCIVKEDKQRGHFRDELVEAVADMVSKRWQPSPVLTWVTAVPSTRHPELVPHFASQLAQRLGLRYIQVITKVRENEPQKLQHNRFHQCHNLDGAFAITGQLPRGSVLLVDDIVDSAWTLTVLAALLRRAGSGPVFPLALATTATGE